tara:strand:+ start:2814 stop:3155 length:342 start_codon:yes stop_codon:yes gene_type:complete
MDSTEQGYTLKGAAEALRVSEMTVRRYIKQGKIVAKKVAGKYGDEYRIEVLPEHLTMTTASPAQDYIALINRLEQLSQEAGYWRARAEIAEGRVKLLEAPGSVRWWRRLFSRG